MGHSFERTHCKRVLVTVRKQVAYKLSGTKSSLSSLERVSRPLYRQDSTCGNRQHYSSVLHKQGRRHEVGPALCPIMENLDLVFQETSDSQSLAHSRRAERSSRQAFQTRPDHPNKVDSPSRGLPSNMQQVPPASNRPICQEVQQQIASVCVTVPDPLATAVDVLSLPWEDLDAYAFPPAAILDKVVKKLKDSPCKRIILITPGWPNMPWFWDLVAIESDPIEPAQPAQSVDTALQSDPSQRSGASAMKELGFSAAVAARIEAPQKGSTRSVYDAKWAIFTKWCLTHQVDYRAPPVKSVADFLMYLFQDRKLQPSNIDVYRSAIADKLGNSPITISKDENLTPLLDSFH